MIIRLKLYLLPTFLVELEVKCTKDAIQVYLNGYLQFSSTKLHDLGEIPDIKEIKVDKPDGNQNVGPMLSFTYGEFIFLIFPSFLFLLIYPIDLIFQINTHFAHFSAKAYFWRLIV